MQLILANAYLFVIIILQISRMTVDAVPKVVCMHIHTYVVVVRCVAPRWVIAVCAVKLPPLELTTTTGIMHNGSYLPSRP